MAARAAERPGGKITAVFDRAADREGAYRFVESVHIGRRAVAEGAWTAAALRAKGEGEEVVYVPVDGSSLALTDRAGAKGYGRMSSLEDSARGAHVMTALALTQRGVPLGVAAQSWWFRKDTRVRTSARKRTVWEKETRYWLDTVRLAESAFTRAQCEGRRWYQCDAGADFRELLRQASVSGQWYTIRACQNRRLADDEGMYLWGAVAAAPVAGTFSLAVPPGRKRAARTACMEVRHATVTLQPTNVWQGSREPFTLRAVWARELGTTPEDETPIEWLLLTNYPVDCFDAARRVIRGYSLRWRVEEFHKAWKSICKVEESQLEQSSFLVWATILASVAVRAERLKQLARDEPEKPAADHFTAAELEAIVLLRQPPDHDEERAISLGDAVRWVADLGGYTGNRRSGPPGSITIGRGLSRVEPAAIAVSRLHARAKT